MKDRKTVIIFYTRGLYDTYALMIADKMKEYGKDCHVICIGDDEYANFASGAMSRAMYKFSMRNAMWMYDLFNGRAKDNKKARLKPLKNIKPDKTELNGIDNFTRDITVRFQKIKNILRRFDPDVILAFTPSTVNAAVKAREQLRMYTTKIYACLTDFCLDKRFFNRRLTGYFVQNDDVKKELVSLGVADDKIVVASFISDGSVTVYEREEIRREMCVMNDKPCIVLIGGRYGAGVIKNVMNTLIEYANNYNLVVLTGGSRTIENVAMHISGNMKDKVFLVRSVDDMTKIYSIADIVVATPTTCVCAESFIYSKPLVLIKGAGHVERANAAYLIMRGYAYDGAGKEKLVNSISDIMINGSKCNAIPERYIGSNIDAFVDSVMELAENNYLEKKIILEQEAVGAAESGNEDNLQAIDGEEIEEINEITEVK